MKKFSFRFAFLLLLFGVGCKTNQPPHPTLAEKYRNGNMTTVMMPPSLAPGTNQPNVVAYMDPAPNLNNPPNPPYLCDQVLYTISFPNRDPSNVVHQTVTLTSSGGVVGGLESFTDDPSQPNGAIFVPAGQSLTTWVSNSVDLMGNGTATITALVIAINTSTNTNVPYGTISNSPIDYPGPNNIGYDMTTYSGMTTGLHPKPISVQVQAADANYVGGQ